MNTAEYITALVAGKVVDLAFIAAAYGGFRLVAGRLQIGAPKAPQVRAKVTDEPAPAAGPGQVTAEPPSGDGKRPLEVAI